MAGFPIRAPPDQSLLTASRGLSQLTTPFIAFWCQGIRHMPFSLLAFLSYLLSLLHGWLHLLQAIEKQNTICPPCSVLQGFYKIVHLKGYVMVELIAERHNDIILALLARRLQIVGNRRIGAFIF